MLRIVTVPYDGTDPVVDSASGELESFLTRRGLYMELLAEARYAAVPDNGGCIESYNLWLSLCRSLSIMTVYGVIVKAHPLDFVHLLPNQVERPNRRD